MPSLRSILLAVLTLWPAAALPQTKAEIPRAAETIEVSLVNVDVVVTDRHGNHVPGLNRDDFVILEDGKPQQISNFAEYRSAEPAAVTTSTVRAEAAAQSAPPRQPRAIVLFIDDFKLPTFKVGPVFDAIKKLLHEVVQPGDNVTIVTWSLHPVVRQEATDDLRVIDAVLARIAETRSGVQRDYMTELRERQEEVTNFLTQATGTAPADDDPMLLFDARNAAEIALYEMNEKVKSLNSLVTSMSGQSGKKVLFIVSHRLGAYAGGEFFYANRSQLTPEDRNRYDTTMLMQSLTNNANAHGVTIYTLFPEGLGTSFAISPEMRGSTAMAVGGRGMATDYLVLNNELASLKHIADETGGSMIYSAVDIARMLPRVREDFDSYYSLAYRISARHDDRARSISVRMKNREYRVRARQHYFESSERREMHDRVVANLLRKPEASAIPVEVAVGSPVQKEKRLWRVPVEVRFPMSSVTTLPEGDASKGAFSVYVANGRLFGTSTDVTRQTVPFTAQPHAADAKFVYQFELLTDFYSDKISVGVLDEVSHEKGFATAALPVRAAAQ